MRLYFLCNGTAENKYNSTCSPGPGFNTWATPQCPSVAFLPCFRCLIFPCFIFVGFILVCPALCHTCVFFFFPHSFLFTCVSFVDYPLFIYVWVFPSLFAGPPVLPALIPAPLVGFLWVTSLWLRHSRTFAGDEHIIIQLPLSMKRYLKNIHTWSNAFLFFKLRLISSPDFHPHSLTLSWKF